MTQSDSTPAAPRALFALRSVPGNTPGTQDGVTGPDPRNAGRASVTEPVTGPVTLPLTPVTVTGNTGEHVTEPAASNAEVVPLTPAERTRLAVTHWAGTAANGAGQLWLHPGRVGHALYHGKPNSIAERRVYVKSRAWVPPELKDDLSGKLIAAEGIAFHWVAGLIQALLLILYAALDRQLRLAGLIAGILVFVLVVLPHIPHP